MPSMNQSIVRARGWNDLMGQVLGSICPWSWRVGQSQRMERSDWPGPGQVVAPGAGAVVKDAVVTHACVSV